MNLQKTVLLFLLASGSVSISTFAPSTPSPITEAPVTKSPASNGITEAPASNGITEAPVTKSPASNGITEAPVTQSPASNTLAPVTTSSASNTLAPVTSSNASNTLAPTTSPAIPFTCTTKEEYLAEMKATHSLCGIKNSTIGWKNITIDTSKACQPACLDRTKAIVSACNITQVGGDGDEATVSAIQNACNPFTCTTKEEYLAEMKATHSLCGIKETRIGRGRHKIRIDRSKACQPACLNRTKAIVSACNITQVGGDVDEATVSIIQNACNPFTCTTKAEYLAEMKATHSLCGIKKSTIGRHNITIDTSKACQPACLNRTKAIVSPCNITQVGGDGDEATVSAINEACDPPAVEISSCTLVTPGVFGLIFAAFLQL